MHDDNKGGAWFEWVVLLAGDTWDRSHGATVGRLVLAGASKTAAPSRSAWRLAVDLEPGAAEASDHEIFIQ